MYWAKRVFLLILFIISLNAQAYIFGHDQRLIIKQVGVYNRIVRVTWGCTGALIGRNIVLTAAHCIQDYIPEPLRSASSHSKKFVAKIKVHAGFIVGRTFKDESYVTQAFWGDFKGYKGDWAILVIKDNLGDKYGYFGYKYNFNSSSSWNEQVNVVGYNYDVLDNSGFSILSGHLGCNVDKHDDKVFVHYCDTVEGASGAPMYKCDDDGCFIVAVHRGWSENPNLQPYFDTRKNEAISVSTYFRILNALRK